ncbi:hypothetical protein HDV00_004806 [Rhizophlyctis rosea]|nr:hypothetical protein HDV00_004806 [Rhizophlyctis rosea]
MKLFTLFSLLCLTITTITAAPTPTTTLSENSTEASTESIVTKTFILPPFLAGETPTSTANSTTTSTTISTSTSTTNRTTTSTPISTTPTSTANRTTTITTVITTANKTTTTTPTPTTTSLEIPPGTIYGQDATERADCLDAHNVVRANVSTLSPTGFAPAPMTYNTTLEYAACKWAKYLAETKQFKHSYGAVGKYGENLYKVAWSTPRSPQAGPQLGSCRPAVKSWAAEVKYYQPGYRIGIDGSFEAYGHYTQIVWPSSLYVGCCGWQSLDYKDFVWACEYQPQGNYYGVAAY